MNRNLALLVAAIIVTLLYSGCTGKKKEDVEKVICSECGVEIAKDEATMLVRGNDTVYFYPEECQYRYLERYGDARCAVCGSELTVTFDTEYVIYDGQTYLMCSRECKEKFSAEPNRFLQENDNQMQGDR